MADPGKGPRGPVPPPIFRQKRRAEGPKKIFWEAAPLPPPPLLPYLRDWMTTRSTTGHVLPLTKQVFISGENMSRLTCLYERQIEIIQFATSTSNDTLRLPHQNFAHALFLISSGEQTCIVCILLWEHMEGANDKIIVSNTLSTLEVT